MRPKAHARLCQAADAPGAQARTPRNGCKTFSFSLGETVSGELADENGGERKGSKFTNVYILFLHFIFKTSSASSLSACRPGGVFLAVRF